MDWLKTAREHLFEVLPVGDPASMQAALKDAAENGGNFTRRRVAKHIAEMTADERLPFARMLLEVATEAFDRPERLRPLFLHVVAALEPNEREIVLRRTFELKVDEYYADLLSGHSCQPSAETWAFIWPTVLEWPRLVEGLVERFGLFRTPPPITVAQAFDHPPVLRALVQTREDAAAEVWAVLIERMDELAADHREDLISMLANRRLERLFARESFAAELKSTLDRADWRASAAYAALWDELSASPEDRLATWSRASGYADLIDGVYATLLAQPKEDFATRLALFLAKIPYDARSFQKHLAGLRTCLENAADRRLAPLLRELIAREPVADERELRDRLRKDLQATNLEVVQMQIKAAEAVFIKRMSDLAREGLPGVEHARATQKIAEEYRAQIAALTESLKQKPTG